MPPNIEDFRVYRLAVEAADEVSALCERPSFRKDFELKDQICRLSGRVAPLMAEGFGLLTDRQLADYLGRARGSALETRGHLRTAMGRRYISQDEVLAIGGKYTSIYKMLTKWIGYLRRSNRRSRG